MTNQVPLKRFWIFAGSDHYPAGGMNDLKDSFDTAEEAAVHVWNAIHNVEDWWQIIDSTTGERIFINITVKVEPVPLEPGQTYHPGDDGQSRGEFLDPPYSHMVDG